MHDEPLEPYPDGRWWVIDHLPNVRFPLSCRGNTGEVYPNVVTPLTGSILNRPFCDGQVRVTHSLGMATRAQLAEFDGSRQGITGVYGGYLYGNVSLARSAAARTPGLTVDMVDRQLFGLSGAPSHRHVRGERDLAATLRSARRIGGGLIRLDHARLAATREVAALVTASAPDVATASDAELLAVSSSLAPHFAQMMHDLVMASALAGVGRSLLERVLDGDDGLVNRLTSGLGTIESAAPAAALWTLGRQVRASAALTESFDAGLDELHARLREARGGPAVARFLDDLDDFRRRHGSRGPDEWELASPTWGSDPTIALATVDRLRHAPDERDPVEVGARLAREREQLAAEVRSGLSMRARPAFDLGSRAAAHYGSQREATKAAFVRLLDVPRRALAELARRSGLEHDDFFLLVIDEVPGALAAPSSMTALVDERRERRDFLQARVPPFWFHGEVPPPHTWALRADHRHVDRSARVLEGIGVCAGTATGPARIVTDPAAPGELQPGDILVAPITDPAWTPLFLAAAGVVVDVGAQQSHAAIVARELGIPAAVSVEGASSTIPSGALVTVDGAAGTVTVHG